MPARPINEYDLLKIFAIFLVVFGHVSIRYNGTSYPSINTQIPQIITQLIYVFHMPLFMALSGAIFQLGILGGKYSSIRPFLANKVLRLLVPYLFVGLIFLIPSIFLFCQINTSISTLYLNFLLGIDCRHLWYLLALFEIFLLHYTLSALFRNKSILFISSILTAVLFAHYVHFDLFCIHMAIRYYPYFILGTMMPETTRKRVKNIIPILIVSVVVIATIIKLNHNIIVDTTMSVILPMPIIFICVELSNKLLKYVRLPNKLIDILLEYSFPVYLFHVMVIYVWEYYMPFVNIPISILCTTVVSISISFLIAKLIKSIHGQRFIGEK